MSGRLELYGGLAPWEDDAGGGEVVADALLRAMEEKGWEVRGVFLTRDPGGAPDPGYPVTLRRLRRRPIENAWVLRSVAGESSPSLRRLVHLSCPEAFLAARHLRGRAALVATAHHYDPPSLPPLLSLQGVVQLRSAQRHFMDRSLLRSSHRVVAVSRFSKECLVTRGYVESGEKVRVIHNGVDESWFQVRSEPGSAVDPVTGVFVGRLDEQKGVDVLLRALCRVPNLRLEVVGEGIRSETYRTLARKLGVTERVSFRGRLDAGAIREILAEAHLSVLPSRAESFGLVALEAMASGLPVVVSRVGGIPEFVEDGRNGLLVPPESVEGLAAALRRLSEDPELREALGRNARESARRLTWSRVAERYAQAYRALLEDLG